MTRDEFKSIEIGTKVEDTWFHDWGLGVVMKKYKTTLHVSWTSGPNYLDRSNMIYDKSHACHFLNIMPKDYGYGKV